MEWIDLERRAESMTAELLEKAGALAGQVLVVGCSTSEVTGRRIGSHSVPEAAEYLYAGIEKAARERGVLLAAQCCEHLNRALIVERETAQAYGWEEVWVEPRPKAGGSFATAAWKAMKDPVAVEHIRAHVGMDIGNTLIGMHLREVAVPVRLSESRLGAACVVCACTRPRYIGGPRAEYKTTGH